MPGWSPFNYVLGNPISLIDPDGRMPSSGGPGDGIGGFFSGLGRGIRDGAVEAFQGIKSLVTDPGGAVDGLATAVSNPGDTYDAMYNAASETFDKVYNGSAGDRGEVFGKSILAIGATVLGDKGLSKLKVLAKLSRGDDLLQGGSRLPDSRIQDGPSSQGRAPIGDDGHPVELHHVDQTMSGPIDEMTRTDHRGAGNYKKNHPNTSQSPSKIDRKVFKAHREAHWTKEWDSGRFDKWINPK
jgi:hypothetical protein